MFVHEDSDGPIEEKESTTNDPNNLINKQISIRKSLVESDYDEFMSVRDPSFKLRIIDQTPKRQNRKPEKITAENNAMSMSA